MPSGRKRILWRVTPLVGLVVAKKPVGENVHRPDADCMACHTADQATLERDHTAARALLAATSGPPDG